MVLFLFRSLVLQVYLEYTRVFVLCVFFFLHYRPLCSLYRKYITQETVCLCIIWKIVCSKRNQRAAEGVYQKTALCIICIGPGRVLYPLHIYREAGEAGKAAAAVLDGVMIQNQNISSNIPKHKYPVKRKLLRKHLKHALHHRRFYSMCICFDFCIKRRYTYTGNIIVFL